MEALIQSVILLTVLCLTSAQERSNNLCLTWKVSTNKLILSCKAQHLDHRVAIIDPLGNTEAECVPPFLKDSCDTHNSYGTISQNRLTNETCYVLKGTIDNHLNGNWSCRHGKKMDLVKVEVTVPNANDRDLVIVTVSDITTDQESLTGKGVNLTVYIVIFAVVTFCLLLVIVILASLLIYKKLKKQNKKESDEMPLTSLNTRLEESHDNCKIKEEEEIIQL